jgi:hypothetical protein
MVMDGFVGFWHRQHLYVQDFAQRHRIGELGGCEHFLYDYIQTLDVIVCCQLVRPATHANRLPIGVNCHTIDSHAHRRDALAVRASIGQARENLLQLDPHDHRDIGGSPRHTVEV